MKVVQSIRDIYNENKELYSKLKSEVDEVLFIPCNDRDWFFRSRLKKEESFALKYEVNSFYKKDNFDDVYGCEIIVNSPHEVDDVKEMLADCNIEVTHQRPEDTSMTHLQPNDFGFKELRLYCKKKSISSSNDEPIYQLVFEIQVKTILSHAWSKSTHDLIYKSKELSWSKSRVAYQIKASLEQAEYQISTIEGVDPSLFPSNKRFTKTNKIIELLNENWDESFLPADMKRLAENVLKLVEIVQVDLTDFESLLSINKNNHRNLSPFLKIIQLLNDNRKTKLMRVKKARSNFDLLIPLTPELNLDEDVIQYLSSVSRIKEISS